MKKYLQVKKEVISILKENEATRDNDITLYDEYIKRNGYQSTEFSARTLFDLIDRGMLPSMDCVGRARREWQSLNEDVQPSISVKERRKHECDEMTEYFRSEK